MSNINIRNEVIKKRYFRFLKEAEGYSNLTIDKIEKSILLYESFTNHRDFNDFNSDNAIAYKNWLKEREYNGKLLAISTYRNYLKSLKKFFTWLSGQQGYKSKIKPDSAKYLKISESEDRIATQFIPRKYPTLEEVIQVVDSIEIKSEIDLRDRAMISFAALSGIRAKALITLPIGCFDPETFVIYQNPKQGVKTKFSKLILSTLFKFDEKLFQIVIDWINHLKTKNFNSYDPLFPRNKIKKEVDNLSFDTSDEVEPFFWKDTGSMREVFKKRIQAANLHYYSPHTFRHLTIHLAVKNCKNGEQLKAVSQNFGHENISTTIGSYANHQPDKLSKVLGEIDFSGKILNLDTIDINKLREISNDLNKFFCK